METEDAPGAHPGKSRQEGGHPTASVKVVLGNFRLSVKLPKQMLSGFPKVLTLLAKHWTISQVIEYLLL